MSFKHKYKSRVNPQMTNHTQFKNLRQRVMRNNPLYEAEFFQTKQFPAETFLAVL